MVGEGVVGHFIIETEGVLTIKGCGRSDSVIGGDIVDDCGGRGSPPAPVIGPQRGSANGSKPNESNKMDQECD